MTIEKHITRAARIGRSVGISFAGILIAGALTFSVAGQAQAATEGNLTLAGARSGVLKKPAGNLVVIDGNKYPLASGAVIQTTNGNRMLATSLEKMTGLTVQYWLGTDALRGHIVQMLITVPR
jgi:hypothetical protein